uniref:ITPR interacting domain containing 1 n=1 Tax=Apteryx owenii TaxID=8824 RepID=A0A8B9QI10_APTOW
RCCFFPTRSLQEFSESPVMSRCNSLNSSHFLTSVPQSVTEWLAIGEKDPVEILLNLGFGTEEPDVCTKIPPRFLSGASVAKGINIQVFLEAQKQRMDIERPNLYGRFRQLEVLDHVTSAFSSLLTDVNTQQSKVQDASRDETGLLDTEKSRPVVTRAKKKIGQLLKKAFRQTTLLKQSSLASGKANSSGWKGQPHSCADIAESGTIQTGFSESVMVGCPTPEQISRDKAAFTVSQCLQTPSGKTWASSHLLPKQPHLSSTCEVPAKDSPKKELHLLLAPTLKKLASQNYKPPDSFELEEYCFLSFSLIFLLLLFFSTEVMVTRTNSCQSDSSGFMEELPEPLVLQVRDEQWSSRCLTEKDVGVACHENVQGGCTEHVKGEWWGMEAVSEDGTPLAVSEVTNGQKFCKTDVDSRNTRFSFERGLPKTLWQGRAVHSESSAISSSSPQIPQSPLSRLAEGPGLSSSEDKETCSIGEMILCANKSVKESTVQNSEMNASPLKSVTVQMSSRLDFTSKMKCAGQNAPLNESPARDSPVDSSEVLAHCSECGWLSRWGPGASKDGLKQTTEASSQTDIPARKTRQLPLLPPPCHHLIKSASLDTVLCGKYGSHYKSEASGAWGAQGCHCCLCCHCCCCHCCCLRTFPTAVSPQRTVGCYSNQAAMELQLWKTLTLLPETAMRNVSPCTIHEIEVMKNSCQQFQEKLDEIEQHLTEQQALFSSALPDEGREERRHLQLLRRAVRQEVAELEFRLNDRAFQVREGILMQLDQLLVEQSHLFSELGLSDWKEERNAQNKQEFPDAAETVHPRSGCSEMVLRRAPIRSTTAAGSLPTLQPGTPIMQFPTRTTLEPNSAESDPQELSTSKKEIKGPPQPKMDFKAFIHNVRTCFILTPKVLSGRDH